MNYEDTIVEQLRGKLLKAGLLPLQSQSKIALEILEERLETYLPKFMGETGIDMWIVAGHETNEDPVMWTMVTPNILYSRRQSALIFYRDPSDGHMERMSWMLGYDMAKYYTIIGTPKDSFSKIVEEQACRLNPQKIAVNINSELGGFCGGLSAWMYKDLTENLSEEYRARLVPAGLLSTKWLEVMTPKEMEVMKVLSSVTEDLMRAFYNRKLIVPGETTLNDVKWFVKNVISRCEMNFWFPPHIDYQRAGNTGDFYGPSDKKQEKEQKPYSDTPIEEGDLLHCDIGVNLRFIRVLTDRQWMCYVKKSGEEHAPDGMQRLFAQCNQFQDMVCEGFHAGKSGNEVFKAGIEKAKNAGLKPLLYTHGLGTYGHGAGPIIGLIDIQGDIYPRGELKVGYESTHALELQHIAPLPEWDNQEIHIFLEEDVHITDKPHYIGERQLQLMEI